MLALQIIPIALATVAITLTLWQFFTGHRPSVSVSHVGTLLVFEEDQDPAASTTYGINVTIKNWGAVRANDITVQAKIATTPYRIPVAAPIIMGVPILFPNQEYPIPLITQERVPFSHFEGAEGAFADIIVTYKSPASLRIGRLSYGHHQVTLSIFVNRIQWIMMPSMEARLTSINFS